MSLKNNRRTRKNKLNTIFRGIPDERPRPLPQLRRRWPTLEQLQTRLLKQLRMHHPFVNGHVTVVHERAWWTVYIYALVSEISSDKFLTMVSDNAFAIIASMWPQQFCRPRPSGGIGISEGKNYCVFWLPMDRRRIRNKSASHVGKDEGAVAVQGVVAQNDKRPRRTFKGRTSKEFDAFYPGERRVVSVRAA